MNLARFNPDLIGKDIHGRIRGNSLVPYATREDIEKGYLKDKGLEILFVDDPVDAFFLQIQGSGRVIMEDGTTVGLGYAGKNGHPYTSIGRRLIDMEGHEQGRDFHVLHSGLAACQPGSGANLVMGKQVLRLL